MGVLANGNVAVAHRHKNRALLQLIGQVVKALDVLGVALGYAQSDPVLKQVYAGALKNEVQLVGVHFGIGSNIQLIHLLLACGNEQVALGAFLYLGLQGTGRIEVIGKRNVGRHGLIHFCDLVHGLRHGSGGEYNQFHGLCLGNGLFGRGRLLGGGGGTGRKAEYHHGSNQ